MSNPSPLKWRHFESEIILSLLKKCMERLLVCCLCCVFQVHSLVALFISAQGVVLVVLQKPGEEPHGQEAPVLVQFRPPLQTGGQRR